MERIKPRTLSGFMELLPQKQARLEKMMQILRDTYSRYGFAPLDTPVIEDAQIREKFNVLKAKSHVSGANAFSEAALIGAYDESREWLDEMNAYVEANHEYFASYIKENIPVLQRRVCRYDIGQIPLGNCAHKAVHNVCRP